MKKKKTIAMTLSESLIALTVVGIIGSVCIPALNSKRPDKDAIMYKKAFMNVTNAFNKATQDPVMVNCGSWKDTNCRVDLCKAMGNLLNTTGFDEETDCAANKGTAIDNYNFRTTDGLIYWGLSGGFSGDTKEIRVDRVISEGEMKTLGKKRGSSVTGKDYSSQYVSGGKSLGLKITLTADGGVKMPPPSKDTDSKSFAYERGLLEKVMEVTE